MLQSIRDKAQGWIAWVIVILIAIPFALWGIQEYFGVDPNIPIAEVNGVEIPLSAYQYSYQRQQAAIRAALGGAADPRLISDEIVRERAIESLVSDQLVMQLGQDAGLRISDERLVSAIRAEPGFQAGGGFSQDAYENFLRRTGSSPGRFEETLRQSLMRQQLIEGIVQSSILTDQEIDRVRGLQGQERVFSELTIPPERFSDAKVEPDAIDRFYEENRSAFMTPEQVRLEYVVLSKQSLGVDIEVDEEALKSLYEDRRANFSRLEQRRARHILVSITDDRDEAAALIRAEELRQALTAGGDFAELARESSDDPGSAENGGDLGFLSRGLLDPALEAVAFELERGQLSEPVRSSFGYHLVEVTEIRAGGTKSFEEARDEIEAEYRRNQAEQAYFEQAEQLANLSFEHPDTLDVVVETLGLTLNTSDFIGRDGQAGDLDLNHPQVIEAAFGDDVLVGGNNSDPIELPDGKTIVLRVAEHREPEQRSLADVRDEIGQSLRARAAEGKAKRLGEEILGKLRSGGDPGEVASLHQLSWSEPRTISRGARPLTDSVHQTVFRMPRPKSGPVYDGVSVADGAFRILRLNEVKDADLGQAQEEAQAMRAAVSQIVGRATYDAFVKSLRRHAEVAVFEDRL